MVVLAMAMVSCGGVDRTDPKSVADAALECFDKGDYVTMKTLVNPENKNLVEEMDRMVERSRKYREEHGDTTYEPKQRTFKKVKDKFTDNEITSESIGAVVEYDGEWPRIVVLEQANGKWYFSGMK